MSVRSAHLPARLAILLVTAWATAWTQGTPLQVGPMSVIVPQGWNGQQGVPVRIFSPGSNQLNYFSVEFFPPEPTGDDVATHHGQMWGRISALARATALPHSGMTGSFIWSRTDVQHGVGQKEAYILYSVKVQGSYIGVAVHATRQDLVTRHLPEVENMLQHANLAGPPDMGMAPGVSGPAAATVPARPGSSSAPGNGGSAGASGTLNDYVFHTPQGWTANQYPDGIVLSSPTGATGEKCLISLWPMRSSSGNLQADANTVFRDVFRTYEPRSQTSSGSTLQPSLARGTAGQGWEYLMMKRGIGKPGPYESLLGFVLVARLGNQVAAISGLSKEPLISTCLGELGPNAWPEFFYSLKFRNWNPGASANAIAKKMVGVWTAATATASDQYTFAANGRYGGAAAAQQYNRISSAEILRTTQAYFGNGAYEVRENVITLKPDQGQPERVFVRLEEESKDEGRSWKEFLYLWRTSSVDGKQYELRYNRN